MTKLLELFEHYNVNMAETLISQPKLLTLKGKQLVKVVKYICFIMVKVVIISVYMVYW